MTKEEALILLQEHFSEGMVRTIMDSLKQEQDEPVAYINVEQRKLEWSKYTSWETPTVVNLPKIPLYTTLQQGCAECGNGGGYALYCLSCAEKFIGNKEWVGLTNEDIEDCYIEELYLFAVALEAKLKEKNETQTCRTN